MNAIQDTTGSWLPRVHLGDPNEPPTFATNAAALECHARAFARIRSLAAQLGCVASRSAIAAALVEAGVIRRISADRRGDLREDCGSDARHYVIPNDEVCDVTMDELPAFEVFT